MGEKSNMLKKLNRIIISNIVIIIIALICIIYPIDVLSKGFFKYTFSNPVYLKMLIELFVCFLIAFVGMRKRNIVWIGIVLLAFCYLHSMLLPILLSIGYTILTVLCGYFLNRKLLEYESHDSVLINYFLGIIFLTVSYAVLSVFHLGNINYIRIYCMGVTIILLRWFYKKGVNIQKIFQTNMKFVVSKTAYLETIVIMIFFMLMIGRANISLDYDSVWYGLRSPYVLAHTNGIYENLKMVGCVYTYSKGYEVYQLPLADTNCYGFMYAGNILIFAVCLLIGYKIFRLFLTHEKSLLGIVLMSSIPGITNMAITAKADIMTLAIQLLSLYFAILYVKEQKEIYFGMVISTFIIAQTLKPTALIFSSTIVILLVFICIVYKKKFNFGKKSCIITTSAIFELILIWIRTYMLTGIPANSIWGNIFRALGLKDKYPYSSSQVFQFKTSGLFSSENISMTLERMKEFFFAPNSADTNHVIIAWGTTLCTFIVFVVFIGSILNAKRILKKNGDNAMSVFFGLLFGGELLGCILSLLVLSKPDGNYFMLYYSSTILVGVVFIEKIIAYKETFNKRVLNSIWIIFVFFNICITGATTWNWVDHFNEIKWVNNGYYNHRMDYKDFVNNEGCVEIYDILDSDSNNRVLAYGTHPDITRFPCLVDSELDINYWGNEKLMETSENFIDYVEYIDYDYVLIWNGYVKEDTQAYRNIVALFDAGKVERIKVENGHILLKIGENDLETCKNFKMQIENIIEAK